MKEKLQQFSNVFVSIISKIAMALIVIFILINLGKSVWRNWQMNQEINKTDQEIQNLEKQNQYLKDLITYYQTDSFKELHAKKELGYKKPGESVLIIPDLTNDQTSDQKSPISSQDKNANITPNFIKWYDYVIGR